MSIYERSRAKADINLDDVPKPKPVTPEQGHFLSMINFCISLLLSFSFVPSFVALYFVVPQRNDPRLPKI